MSAGFILDDTKLRHQTPTPNSDITLLAIPPTIQMATVGGTGGLGPAWTRGDIEAPAGEKDMGTWTAAVYTPEQQERLNVDEQGKKKKKTAWPELVGKNGQDSIATIQADNSDVSNVHVVAEGAMVTMDVRMDRVRVFVNAEGNIVKNPSIG